MKTSRSNIVLWIVCGVVAGFAIGRISAPAKVKVEKEYVKVEDKTKTTDEKTRTDTNRDKKVRKITTETILPDGTKKITTEVVEDSTTRRVTDKDVETNESEKTTTVDKETKTVDYKKPSVSLSALAGSNLRNLTAPPELTYGAHVQKNVIGPFSLGAWGFTNGQCGLSVGISL